MLMMKVLTFSLIKAYYVLTRYFLKLNLNVLNFCSDAAAVRTLLWRCLMAALADPVEDAGDHLQSDDPGEPIYSSI